MFSKKGVTDDYLDNSQRWPRTLSYDPRTRLLLVDAASSPQGANYYIDSIRFIEGLQARTTRIALNRLRGVIFTPNVANGSPQQTITIHGKNGTGDSSTKVAVLSEGTYTREEYMEEIVILLEEMRVALGGGGVAASYSSFDIQAEMTADIGNAAYTWYFDDAMNANTFFAKFPSDEYKSSHIIKGFHGFHTRYVCLQVELNGMQIGENRGSSPALSSCVFPVFLNSPLSPTFMDERRERTPTMDVHYADIISNIRVRLVDENNRVLAVGPKDWIIVEFVCTS